MCAIGREPPRPARHELTYLLTHLLTYRERAASTGTPLEQSIWAARSVWSDSKSFYDETRVAELRLKLDWGRAIKCGIGRFIAKVRV